MPQDATAYSTRSANFSVAALGTARSGLNEYWDERMKPLMDGLYLSFETSLSPARFADTWSPSALARLRALQSEWDPEGALRDHFGLVRSQRVRSRRDALPWEIAAVTLSWDVVDIAEAQDASRDEPMGSKEKFWVVDPDGADWLFKFARAANGITRNEDWAEWLVHHLANLVGVPTARVRPAMHHGRRGVVSRSVLAPGDQQSLVHGNELIRDFDLDYQVDTARENPGYTVAIVERALRHVAPPLTSPELARLTGYEVMAG